MIQDPIIKSEILYIIGYLEGVGDARQEVYDSLQTPIARLKDLIGFKEE